MNQVRELLELASETTPRESDPVGAVLRRHRSARRRTAVRTAAVGVAASVILVGSVAWLGMETRPRDAGHVPAGPPVVTPSTGEEGGLNGVTLEATGMKTRMDGDPCGIPGTVAVLPDTHGIAGCGTGPSATISRLTQREWASGQPSWPGLTIRDGTPVWISAPAGPEGEYATIVVPSRGVVVTIHGDEQQRNDLVADVRVSSQPAAESVFASTTPPLLASLRPLNGDWLATARETGWMRELTTVLEQSPRVRALDDHTCTPSPDSTVFLDLATSDDSDPETGRAQDFTHFVTDLSGECGLVFSSTGAVLRTDRRILDPLLDRMRSGQG